MSWRRRTEPVTDRGAERRIRVQPKARVQPSLPPERPGAPLWAKRPFSLLVLPVQLGSYGNPILYPVPSHLCLTAAFTVSLTLCSDASASGGLADPEALPLPG